MRRRHSLSEVADIAGLPLGTVKSIISRSGLFADNPRHRAMFTMPPRQNCKETLPASPELPPQQVVTGDKEIDALLWLRQVIETGDPGRIEQAKEAACRIPPHSRSLRRATVSGWWPVPGMSWRHRLCQPGWLSRARHRTASQGIRSDWGVSLTGTVAECCSLPPKN